MCEFHLDGLHAGEDDILGSDDLGSEDGDEFRDHKGPIKYAIGTPAEAAAMAMGGGPGPETWSRADPRHAERVLARTCKSVLSRPGGPMYCFSDRLPAELAKGSPKDPRSHTKMSRMLLQQTC